MAKSIRRVTNLNRTFAKAYARRVGLNLAHLRELKGLTQEDLVKAAQQKEGGEGLYRQSLSKAELGERVLPVYILEAVCMVFLIDLNLLLHSEDLNELKNGIGKTKSNKS